MNKVTKYLGEVRTELVKASWPWDPKEKGFKKYKTLIDSTVVIFIAMMLMGAFVAFWDIIMLSVVEFLTS